MEGSGVLPPDTNLPGDLGDQVQWDKEKVDLSFETGRLKELVGVVVTNKFLARETTFHETFEN